MKRQAAAAAMTTASDEALVAAWQQGDTAAGAVLVRRHERVLRRQFGGHLRDVCDDLIQQTLLVCTQNVHRIEDAAKFRRFLVGVGRRVALTHARSNRTRTDRYAALRYEPTPVAQEPGSRLVRLREDSRDLVRAVEQLPADWQVAVVMHYWHGLSAAEIAQMQDVAEGTVKSWLSRSRAELRRRLPAELATSETLSAVPRTNK